MKKQRKRRLEADAATARIWQAVGRCDAIAKNLELLEQMSKARQVVLSVEESQREIWVETVKSAADRLVDSIAGSAIESLKEIKACLEIKVKSRR